jgi:hypothetical protein
MNIRAYIVMCIVIGIIWATVVPATYLHGVDECNKAMIECDARGWLCSCTGGWQLIALAIVVFSIMAITWNMPEGWVPRDNPPERL